MNTPRSVNTLLLRISVGVCAISIVVFSFLLLQSSNSREDAFASNYSGDQIIVAVNQQRLNNGLDPLIVNPLLMTSSQNKANHMATNKYFSHIGYGKKWSDFIKEAGYNYVEAGENLANGFTTVPDMVTAWMNSPSHRENILNPSVRETGVGLAYGELDGYPTIFVAQVFGRLQDSPAQPSQAPVGTTPVSQPVNSEPKDTNIATQPTTPQNNPTPAENPITTPTQNPEQKPEANPTESEPSKQPDRPQTLGELLTLPETIVGQ